MLLLLPLLTFVLVFLLLVSYQPTLGLRFAYLQALLLCGAYLAITSELLSALSWLTSAGVTLAWMAGLLLAAGFAWKSRRLKTGWTILKSSLPDLKRDEAAILLLFAAILVVLGLSALIAPPNNTDSLQYHMSRVVHWAQNRSLNPYPTGYEPQLIHPIWAELAILHLRLLWGNDQFANLVQFGALLSVLIAVSLLAAMLGANRKGQLAAAAFALSIPLVVLQSTSTQNDLITTLWFLCLACLVILSTRRSLTVFEYVCLALAFGLGLLTKGTFYPYSVPVGVLFLFFFFRQLPLRRALLTGALIAVVAFGLNTGYWVRNLSAYGTPFGPSSWISSLTTTDQFGPGPMISTLVKYTAMNFVTPFYDVNEWIIRFVYTNFMWADPNLRLFNLWWGWNHEDTASNPLHVLLAGLSLLSLPWVLKRHPYRQDVRRYALVIVGMFLMLGLVIKYDRYGLRFLVPILVGTAPVFGLLVSSLSRPFRLVRLLPMVMTVALLAASLPWVLFNRSRPLIAMRDNGERWTIPCYFGCTSIGSILMEHPSDVLFANWMELRDPYKALAADLRASGCGQVGLRIDSQHLEYLFWSILEAPQSGIRIETIYYDPVLEKFADSAFKPCAVICTICFQERQELHGLELYRDYGPVKLFQGEEFVNEEG